MKKYKKMIVGCIIIMCYVAITIQSMAYTVMDYSYYNSKINSYIGNHHSASEINDLCTIVYNLNEDNMETCYIVYDNEIIVGLDFLEKIYFDSNMLYNVQELYNNSGRIYGIIIMDENNNQDYEQYGIEAKELIQKELEKDIAYRVKKATDDNEKKEKTNQSIKVRRNILLILIVALIIISTLLVLNKRKDKKIEE